MLYMALSRKGLRDSHFFLSHGNGIRSLPWRRACPNQLAWSWDLVVRRRNSTLRDERRSRRARRASRARMDFSGAPYRAARASGRWLQRQRSRFGRRHQSAGWDNCASTGDDQSDWRVCGHQRDGSEVEQPGSLCQIPEFPPGTARRSSCPRYTNSIRQLSRYRRTTPGAGATRRLLRQPRQGGEQAPGDSQPSPGVGRHQPLPSSEVSVDSLGIVWLLHAAASAAPHPSRSSAGDLGDNSVEHRRVALGGMIISMAPNARQIGHRALHEMPCRRQALPSCAAWTIKCAPAGTRTNSDKTSNSLSPTTISCAAELRTQWKSSMSRSIESHPRPRCRAIGAPPPASSN